MVYLAPPKDQERELHAQNTGLKYVKENTNYTFGEFRCHDPQI